jgi:hypothetical protein
MEEGSDYYVVKKGDMVAVYKTLNGCQEQICSSVSGPAASAYKGYCWSKEKAEYLSSRGLVNAAYIINAAGFREDLLGALVPCTLQDITGPSSNQLAPNLSGICSDTRYQPGICNDVRYQPGTQPVDMNYVSSAICKQPSTIISLVTSHCIFFSRTRKALCVLFH